MITRIFWNSEQRRLQAFWRWCGSMDTELVMLADHLGHGLNLFVRAAATAEFCTGGCTLRLATLEDVFLKLTGRGLRE